MINTKNGITEATHGYRNCNTSQILIFSGYVEVRESFYAQVIIWVNTILNHIDTRAIYLGMKVLAWYIDLNGIGNINSIRYPYPTNIKICEILIVK